MSGIIGCLIGFSLSAKNKAFFWKEVKNIKLSYSSRNQQQQHIDGLTSETDISNTFRSKLSEVFNCCDTSARDKLSNDLNASLFANDLSCLSITQAMVEDCLMKSGRDISDGSLLSSNHLILAAPINSSFLSSIFSVILRHGHMPKAVRDCMLNPSLSDSYRPIALAHNLS